MYRMYAIKQFLPSSSNPNKASLNVPNKPIKLASGQLHGPITEIYSKSILSGEFPEIFKIFKSNLNI